MISGTLADYSEYNISDATVDMDIENGSLSVQLLGMMRFCGNILEIEAEHYCKLRSG